MGKTFILLVFVFNNVFVNLSSCLSLLMYSWRSGSALRRGGPRGRRAGLGVLPVHGACAANAQPAAVCWGVICRRGNACGKTTLPTLGKKKIAYKVLSGAMELPGPGRVLEARGGRGWRLSAHRPAGPGRLGGGHASVPCAQTHRWVPYSLQLLSLKIAHCDTVKEL